MIFRFVGGCAHNRFMELPSDRQHVMINSAPAVSVMLDAPPERIEYQMHRYERRDFYVGRALGREFVLTSMTAEAHAASGGNGLIDPADWTLQQKGWRKKGQDK